MGTMVSLSRVLIRLPLALRGARRSQRRVRSLSKKLGAGLTPLEHRLDELVEFFDWFDERMRPSKMRALVCLLRESERYDSFHEIAADIASRRNRLVRLSTTFTPIQRGRYRSLLSALGSFHARLERLDALLFWIVRHPQEVSRRLARMFAFSSRRPVRYSFDPSGAMLFGDGMDDRIEEMFSIGPRRFKRSVRSFIAAAFSSDEGRMVLERLPAPFSIRIASVSAAHSSIASKRGVEISINALEFFAALESDPSTLVHLIGSTREVREESASAEHRVLITIKNHAISALSDVWRKRSLSSEYAGVLSVERLEIPSHTGSFDSADAFVRYADKRVADDFASYLARDIGLHIGWILFCDRMGYYRPISTAAIREIAGRKNAGAVFKRIIAEMRSSDARTLIKRYVKACQRLTRAPLIDDPEVL